MDVSGAETRNRLEGGGARLESEGWFKALARSGIGARAAIYLILAWLACDIAALGRAPAQTSGTGALQEVARQYGGALLLTVLAGGLAAYGVWRVVQAIATPSRRHRGRVDLERVGWLTIAIIYFALAGQAVKLIAGESGGVSTSSPKPYVAHALGWPGGPELVGLAGAVLVVGGVALAAWGIMHRYEAQLDLSHVKRHWRAVVRVTGAVGELTRGVLVASVGALTINAAVDDDPGKAKSIDQTLRSLAHDRLGPTVVSLVALGLFCFGVYTVFESRLRKL